MNPMGTMLLGMKRSDSVCTVRGRITPEHKVKSTPYHVEVVINEAKGEEKVITCVCKDCSAASGLYFKIC